MEEKVKYFPEESLSFWDKLRCFSGMWEQVETGKYLPIVISEEGENLGVDGNPDEIAEAQHGIRMAVGKIHRLPGICQYNIPLLEG